MVTAASPNPNGDDAKSAAKPPEGTLAPDGTPFTPPAIKTESIASGSLNASEIANGAIPPKIDQIIGNAVNKPDFFKEQVFGTPASTWSGMSEIQITSALTNNPSLLDTLAVDIKNGASSAFEFGKKMGTDIINETGYAQIGQSYDKLDASISAAQGVTGVAGTAKAYATVAKNVAGLTAATINTATKVSSLSVDVIKAKQYLNLQCTKKLVNKYVDDLTENLKENWDDIKDEFKDIETKLKDANEALKDKASELRKAIDKYDEKAYDEFVNANHKDAACRKCAQKAVTSVESGNTKAKASREIVDCLYNEYLAFKQVHAKSVPLTDKSVVDQINGNCP